MAEKPAAEAKGEVWMLDTFGNVHSLVNACKQLGFKVNRISDPKQIDTATVLPPLSLPPNLILRKSSSAAWGILGIVWLPSKARASSLR
jgi:hypothetical protein